MKSGPCGDVVDVVNSLFRSSWRTVEGEESIVIVAGNVEVEVKVAAFVRVFVIMWKFSGEGGLVFWESGSDIWGLRVWWAHRWAVLMRGRKEMTAAEEKCIMSVKSCEIISFLFCFVWCGRRNETEQIFGGTGD